MSRCTLQVLLGTSIMVACTETNPYAQSTGSSSGASEAGTATVATLDPDSTLTAGSADETGSSGQMTSSSTDVADATGSSSAATEVGTASESTSSDSASSSSTGPAVVCEPDGVVGEGETCDDDNPFDDDGCTNCQVDDGFVCYLEPSVCVLACDPLVQDCAAAGFGCYPFEDGDFWACYVDASGEMGDFGDFCEYPNVCHPGLACADAAHFESCDSVAGCCTQLCDLDSPMCPVRWSCISYYAGVPPLGYENVGICVWA